MFGSFIGFCVLQENKKNKESSAASSASSRDETQERLTSEDQGRRDAEHLRDALHCESSFPSRSQESTNPLLVLATSPTSNNSSGSNITTITTTTIPPPLRTKPSRRRVLVSSASREEDSGNETKALRRSSRISREINESFVATSPSSSLNTRDRATTVELFNRSSPNHHVEECRREMTPEWITARGRGAGVWLLRFHPWLQERTYEDMWCSLARLRAAFPNLLLASTPDNHPVGIYVSSAFSTPQRYWRGLLPENHPCYKRGSRTKGKPRSGSGKYVGLSCDKESDAEDECQQQRRRVFSLLTEDEVSEDNIDEDLDAADWVLSAGELMKRISTEPLSDDINPSSQTAIIPSSSSSPSASLISSSSTRHPNSPDCFAASSTSPPNTLSSPSPSSSSQSHLAATSSITDTPGQNQCNDDDNGPLSQFERVDEERREAEAQEDKIAGSEPRTTQIFDVEEEERVRRRRRCSRLSRQSRAESEEENKARTDNVALSSHSTFTTTPRSRSNPPPTLGSSSSRKAQFAEDRDEDDDYFSSDNEEVSSSNDLLPNVNLLPRSEIGTVEFSGEDFLRLSVWLEGFPRGRALSERSLLSLQDNSQLQGGSVAMLRGDGIVEIGMAEVDLEGFDIDWEEDLVAIEEQFATQEDWSGVRLWELLPAGYRGFLGRAPVGVIPEAQTKLVPRTVWRPVALRTTPTSRCVGCLCVELEARATYEAMQHQWSKWAKEKKLQS